MHKELIQTGKSVNEAIQSACLLLGIKVEDCQFEIIDLPKSSFFGLKKNPAKVRVWAEFPDEVSTKKPQPVEKPVKQAQKQNQKPQPKPANEKPAQTPQPKPAPKPPVQKPAPAVTAATSAPAPAFREDAKAPTEDYVLTDQDKVKIEFAREYISGIIEQMGVTAETTVTYENSGACISVVGKGLGVLIGRRGETLNSLQYLAGLVANRLEGEYLRITVDAGDYRLKRIQALEEMAQKAAEQVLSTDISKVLESMNPAERRIVHSVISGIEGVSSASIGVEPYRRVVVKTPTSKMRSSDSKPKRSGGRNEDRDTRNNRDRRDSRGGGRRDNDRNRDRGPKPVIDRSQPPVVTPEGQTGSPLYGKIDLD